MPDQDEAPDCDYDTSVVCPFVTWADENIDRLRAALKECADDLEAELGNRYGDLKDNPAMASKYWRDMAPVRAARELLKCT